METYDIMGVRCHTVDGFYEPVDLSGVRYALEGNIRITDFSNGARWVQMRKIACLYYRTSEKLLFCGTQLLNADNFSNPSPGLKLLTTFEMPPLPPVPVASPVPGPAAAKQAELWLHPDAPPFPSERVVTGRATQWVPPKQDFPRPPAPPVISAEGVSVEVHVAKLSMDLIPLDLADATEPRVNARDLHAFLEIGKVFGAWIQELIEKHQFVEGQDFTVVSKSGNNPQGGRPAKEYALTFDMAKEVSMLAANEKGRRARRYFIDCEKQLRQSAGRPDLGDRLSVLKVLEDTTRQAIVAEEGRRMALTQVAALEDVVEKNLQASTAEIDRLISKVEAPKRAVSFKQFFKEQADILGYTTRTGYPYLLAAGILVRGQKSKWNEVYVPAADYDRIGLFTVVNTAYERPDNDTESPDPTSKLPLTVQTCSTRLTPDITDGIGKVIRQGGYGWLLNRMLKDPRTTLSRMQATTGGPNGKYGKLYGCQLVEVKRLELLDDRTTGPEVIHFFKFAAKKPADVRWEVSRHIGEGRLLHRWDHDEGPAEQVGA